MNITINCIPAFAGLTLLACLLTSCLTPEERATANKQQEMLEVDAEQKIIVVADVKMIEGCDYLKELSCNTIWVDGFNRCKGILKVETLKIGGTHIFWQNIASTGNESYVSGVAYKCRKIP